MWLAPDRGEEHETLGQAPVEGVRVLGPADGLDAVPERLVLERVVEQDRVPEVAQVPARRRVHLRLVEEHPAHRVGVDVGRAHARPVGAFEHRGHDSGWCQR